MCRWCPAALPSAPTRTSSGKVRELPDRAHAQLGEPAASGRPDSPQALDAEWVEECELGTGLDDEQAIGLGEVARQFRQQLRARGADGRDQAGPVVHAAADRDGDLRPRAVQAPSTGDVEERLVEGDRLHERRERAQDLHDRTACVAVGVEPRREEHTIGARTTRSRHGHRGVHAEAASLVARGRDDTTRAQATDDDRLPRQRGIVELLDRRVERIEVDVQDRRRVRAPGDVSPPTSPLRTALLRDALRGAPAGRTHSPRRRTHADRSAPTGARASR